MTRLIRAVACVVFVAFATGGAFYGDFQTQIDSNTRLAISDYETGVLPVAGARPLLAINGGDPTAFDLICSGVRCEGIVVDKIDPNDPHLHEVLITDRVAVADAFPASDTTWILLDETDTLSQTNVAPLPLDRRQKIVLGSLVKAGGVIVQAVNDQTIAYGMLKTVEDFLELVGGISGAGADITADSGMRLNISAGEIISLGRGVSAEVETPHTTLTPAQTPIPVGRLFLSYVGAGGNVVIDPSGNELDPDQYVSGTTLTAVPAGKYTVQRAILFPESDVLAVYYGTEIFDTIADAAEHREDEAWAEHPGTRGGAFRAWIIVQQGTTSLSAALAETPARAAIIRAGSFRPTVSSSTGIPTGQVIASIADTTAQKPGTTNPTVVAFNTDIELEVLTHPRPEDLQANTAAALSVVIQYQVERTITGGVVDWHGWLRQGRRDGDITAVGTGNPAPLEMPNHRITTGQSFDIPAGCVTSASITGTHVATVIDADHVSIPVNVTSVTDGECTWTRGLDVLDDVPYSNVQTTLLTQNQSSVTTSPFVIRPEEGDVVQVWQSVSDSTKNAGIVSISPAGEPVIPSARLSVTATHTQ